MTPRTAPAPDDAALDGAAAPTLPVHANRWTLPAACVGAAALGVFVFTSLSQGRAVARSLTDAQAGAAPASSADAPPPPTAGMDGPVEETPPAKAPAPPPRPGAALLVPAPGPTAFPGDPGNALRAPSLVVDLSSADAETAVLTADRALSAAAKGAAGGGVAGDKAGDRQVVNERFAAGVGSESVETVRAKPLRAPGEMILQGTVIPAVLETALNTDLPGYLRAVVAQDVKSFDGSTVLIPRGSRLIGQYRSAVARGQSRAFVIWSRLIRPDGASVMLSSPGGDALGRAGLTGSVDNHFFRQFGSAILLSVITAGSNALANNNAATLIIGSSSTTEGPPATTFLNKETDIPPTVKVPQGAPMTIFVAKDLDFADVVDGR